MTSTMRDTFWVIEGELAGRAGPWIEPWDLRELWSAGFRTIVSLQDGFEDPEAIARAGFQHVPLYLPPIALTTEEEKEAFLASVPEFIAAVDRSLAAKRPVLAHCRMGLDRTGAMLACYLVARERLGAAAALARVRAVRPGACVTDGYEEVVHVYAARRAEARRA